MELKEVKVVERDEGYFYTVADLNWGRECVATLSAGRYEVKLTNLPVPDLPHCTLRLGVINDKVEFMVAPHGELEPVCARITINGGCLEFPNKIKGLIRKIPEYTKNENTINNLVESSCSNVDKVEESLLKMAENSDLEQEQLFKLLQENKDVFAVSDKNLGNINAEAQIKLRDLSVDPEYSKPYPVPWARRPFVRKKIKEMMDSGLIELAQSSPFASPLHVVKKSQKLYNDDGTKIDPPPPPKYRLVTDYRNLNKLMVQDRHVIPNMKIIWK